MSKYIFLNFVVLMTVLYSCKAGQTIEPQGTETEKPKPQAPVSEKQYPSDVVKDLYRWKVTLPVDKDGKDNSAVSNVDERNRTPLEISDSALINYEYPPYFRAENGEIFLRGHCAGTTTSGSKYPRSELRQRVGGGNNYWSVEKPQYLQTELRVTAVPKEKPEVCITQIHGPEDEPLRVQYLAGTGVYIVWNEDNKETKSALPYTLGEKLRISVTVDKGNITCQIENLDRNSSFTKTWKSMDATGYFKVGCYTQSSVFLSQIKSGAKNEPLDAYGEVAVSKIVLRETY